MTAFNPLFNHDGRAPFPTGRKAGPTVQIPPMAIEYRECPACSHRITEEAYVALRQHESNCPACRKQPSMNFFKFSRGAS